MITQDSQVRLAAFDWLADRVSLHGEALPRTVLADGFNFQGTRVPLLGPQGIFKPKLCELPLSITTSPESPYDDTFSPDGLLAYRYRGDETQTGHHENVGLRRAMVEKTPLVYFHGLVPGQYQALWPVFIVGDNLATLTFSVAVDDMTSALGIDFGLSPASVEVRREYITVLAKRRLHQEKFRAIVIQAYRERCAICRLRHVNLLDAAHIIDDRLPDGVSTVQNGISLCKLHHKAYDTQIVGITPDYEVRIRGDILEESDGPTLEHGLKGMHGEPLTLPVRKEWWPDREKLEVRFERFRGAA